MVTAMSECNTACVIYMPRYEERNRMIIFCPGAPSLPCVHEFCGVMARHRLRELYHNPAEKLAKGMLRTYLLSHSVAGVSRLKRTFI
jgi:hypothetical protein